MAITITDGLSSLNSGPEKREKQIVQINIKCLKIPTGRRQNSWLIYTAQLSSWNRGDLRTNLVSGRVEDLNPGPPDYKSSALATQPF